MLESEIRALFDRQHAPTCTVDAGGACFLHSDERDAFVAGWRACEQARARTRYGANLTRPRRADHVPMRAPGRATASPGAATRDYATNFPKASTRR